MILNVSKALWVVPTVGTPGSIYLPKINGGYDYGREANVRRVISVRYEIDKAVVNDAFVFTRANDTTTIFLYPSPKDAHKAVHRALMDNADKEENEMSDSE
jgi:hypothetical protein